MWNQDNFRVGVTFFHVPFLDCTFDINITASFQTYTVFFLFWIISPHVASFDNCCFAQMSFDNFKIFFSNSFSQSKNFISSQPLSDPMVSNILSNIALDEQIFHHTEYWIDWSHMLNLVTDFVTDVIPLPGICFKLNNGDLQLDVCSDPEMIFLTTVSLIFYFCDIVWPCCTSQFTCCWKSQLCHSTSSDFSNRLW